VDDYVAHQRIAEIGEILAAGLGRVWAQKSSGKQDNRGESSLDFSATKSGHPTFQKGEPYDG
jgi:hypothetical protein